jgi:hypothetical protein
MLHTPIHTTHTHTHTPIHTTHTHTHRDGLTTKNRAQHVNTPLTQNENMHTKAVAGNLGLISQPERSASQAKHV